MAISTKKLMTGIQDELEGQVVGYALAIYQNGALKRSHGSGWAVIDSRKFDSHVRACMGSMGKTISAAAIVRALQRSNRSVDEPIHKVLDWSFSASSKKLTYRMVLTHTTGISPGQGTTTADLKKLIKGAIPAVPAPGAYSNANYDLTRYLLPELALPDLSVLDALPAGPQHIALVKSSVLKPCGLDGVDVVYKGPEPRTRYYTDVTDRSKFHESHNLQLANEFVGAGWWTTSVREYGRLIDRLRHQAALPGVWQTMSESAAATDPNVRLGMYRTTQHDGDAFNHNGGFDGHFSAWVAFPNGITAVAVANSNYTRGMQEVILDAYENAKT